jgi:hypothetical protein
METQSVALADGVPGPPVSTDPADKAGLPVWDAGQLRLAISAAGVALWAWNVDTNRFAMDERAFDLWGVPLSDYVSFDDLSSHIHPADRDRVKAAFSATRAIIGAYEIDFRIMVGEEVRWVSARGQGNDAGIVGRIMYGIFIDVTGRKQAEEGHELLAGEMSHRVKNLLAIASGLTAITSRSAKTTADMAKELTQRLTALGRAHDLVRPLPGQGGKAALLGDLLTVCLRLMTISEPLAAASASRSPVWASASKQLRRLRSSSTNWPPIRSSMARFPHQPAHWIYLAPPMIRRWSSSGPSAAALRSRLR